MIKLIDDYIKQKRYRLINSILMYKDNELILERYYNKFNEDSRNNIKSIWKSILSICVGICADKGYLNIDDPICKYLPQFNKNIHMYHKQITIKHLLTMTSGIYWNGGIHYHCPMIEQLFRSNDWLEHLADVNMISFPGTKYVYKEWDVILLSAVVSKATNMSTYDFCNKYLYSPLNIKSGEWSKSKCKIDYNINVKNPSLEKQSDLSAKDLAKLGFLILNNGIYNNQKIVSSEYLKKALIASEQNSNYGFLIWLFDFGFGFRGYGGQEVSILPKENIIYVIQATPTLQSKSYGDVFYYINKNINVK